MFKRLIKSETFRQRTVWVVAAVLVLPFIIIFSSSTPIQGPGDDAAGRLFGRPVSWETFRQQQFWLKRQLPEELAALPESLLTQATWERLILLEEAKRRQVRVNDRRVAALIQATPAFQVEGRFDPERYRQFLKATGTSPQLFEAFLREDLTIQQLLDEVKASVQVTDELLRDAYRTRHEKASIALLSWDVATQVPAATKDLSDDTVKTYYDEYPEEFQERAQVTFDYLGQTREEVADLNALAADLDVGLREEQTLEALAAASKLAIRSVGPLAVGDLWAEGAPEPAVLQEAFRLPAGGVSDVIETDTGVYVVRVRHLEPAHLKPLDEVRDAVRQRAATQRARTQTVETARDLRGKLQQALTGGASFEDACRQLKLTPTAPPPFARGEAIEGLGNVPAVHEAVFATEAGHLTQVVELLERAVLALVRERTPPTEEGFEAERETLAAQVRQEQEQSRLGAWIEEVRSRARLQSFVEDPADS